MDLFNLYASISLDSSEYESALSGASSSTSSFADTLKNGLATAAKIGAAAVAAASTAVGVLVKDSLEQYAEYEQLVGGVETLFKDSAGIVQEYAANAYKTAGLSANEYMETVTSFSASLLQSLGNDTEAAAEKADLAITDMSDNANKMGTSMESIQNAYQGFAKANYTMLDNLKLGYGGTKEEMQRLLDDATALSGVEYDISSYADIVDAIHVVQTELGITGTTALEASTTIQGSIASMKSAWTNLVTGIADENADLDQLIGNFVDSVSTVGENIIPRVEQILSGIGEAVGKLAPIIAENVPELVTNVLPSFLASGVQLIDGLLQGMVSALPSLAESSVSIIETLANALIEQLPALLDSAMQVIVTLAGGISESLPELIPTIVDVVIQIVETLIDNVDMLVDAAIEIILALAEGLINALPKLIEKAPEIIMKLVTALVTNVPKLLEAAVEIIAKLASGIISNIPNLIKAIPQVIAAIVSGFGSFMSSILEIGKNIVNKVGEGIKSLASSALQWGKDLIDNFVQGIKNKISAVTSAVSSIASTVKSFLGFSEPEEGPLSNFHTYAPDMMKLFASGIEDNAGLLKDAFEDSLDFGTASVDYSASGLGQSSGTLQSTFSKLAASISQDGAIVVQVVLDGKVIGEASYQYARNKNRAYAY